MTEARDVAAYIVRHSPYMTTMKLQKLIYYSYVEYAKRFEKPLFDEEFEAWCTGPVVKSIYRLHQGKLFAEQSYFPQEHKLNADEIKAIDSAISKYAGFTPRELSEKTHSELPWRSARGGIPSSERSSNKIPFETVLRWVKANN